MCALFSVGCFLIGCTAKSGESSNVNQPPAIRSITLGPTPFDRQSDLIAQVETHDPNNDVVRVQYYWHLNDQLLNGEKSPTLSAALLKQGDRVHLEAVPFDGHVAGGRLKSETITVGDAPPSITQVGIGVKSDVQGDRLQALIDVSDRDQDLARFHYRWTKNGRVMKEGGDDFLEMTDVKPHDLVTVEVMPRDGTAIGKAVRSDPYVVGNRAPKIISSPPLSTAQNRYEYSVKVLDPDSDSVQFRLEVAPSGMTIDAGTGHVLWDMGHVKPGVHRVKVVAMDEQGGSSFQEFELSVAAPELAKPVS